VNISSKNLLYICLSIALLIVVIIVSLNTGYAQIPFSKIPQIVMKNVPILGDLVQLAPDITEEEIGIIMQIRLPRTLSAAVAGAALAVAGLVYQGLFQNQMASPYIIGASSGAALGGALAILLGLELIGLGFSLIPLFAFFGCLLSLLVVYSISRVGTKIPKATLLLAGLSINMLFSLIFAYLEMSSGSRLHQMTNWLVGSFSTVLWRSLYSALPLFILGIIGIYICSHALNTISLAENGVEKSGNHFERTRLILVVFSAIITAAAVSISGIIGFVGLLVPHLAKMFIGLDYRFQIPFSAILGSIFLIACDCLARSIVIDYDMPVALITSTLGIPFFVYLLFREKKEWLPQR